ncbi:CG9044 [Drosophila busckii]|uniref:CG9044 n=1 Tax=Drosophila busckii TaxID=30019 RepID=A0A0M4E6U3_DROBS|nr:CG9044 [Drosophila busckii]
MCLHERMGSLLRALNDSFTLIADSDIGVCMPQQQQQQAFQVVKPINAKSSVFPDLQLLHDFVQKTTLLKLNYFPSEHYFEGAIDINKFRALRRLEVHKIYICQVVGIQALRSQLQQLICIKSLRNVEDIITRCGGDNSNGFVWNELQLADFSYNSLRSVDTALEFAQHLQHLNLRHNKLVSVLAIKWLPHLKTLDLSYNCLTHLPQFHAETCKRLQLLNISNNYVEELLDVHKLDALTNLDLSDNCLLDHSQLLPLSRLMTLAQLNLQGNPLACHPKHRLATAQYLHKNTATVKFVLDFEPLAKAEKMITGSQHMRFVASHHRLNSSHMSINSSRMSTGTPASSVGSQRSLSQPTQEATDSSSSHLETKKQIETLRRKYGTEWLQSANAELKLDSQPSEQQCNDARQQFNEYLGEFSASAEPKEAPRETPAETLNISSTPTNNGFRLRDFDSTLTPIKIEATPMQLNETQQTVYESCDNSTETQYESINNTLQQQQQPESAEELDKHKEVLNSYAAANWEEEQAPVSDEEPDEKFYIVCEVQKASEPLFLTISNNYMREKDALSERTKTKWSLKVLESCERIKANTLRINFDTIQKDKQERIYCIENELCQELEKKLRDILSQRDLNEMNITIYNCVSCGFKFSRESKKTSYKSTEPSCPNCRSVFVAEVNDVSGSLDKPKEPKLSPALIVEESPVDTPLVLQSKEDNQSIGKFLASSANSLNESSSCSKITNSQCSFDSNQSVVGSSNTERDLEFRANESDVDIISNPSQSSIEVLDPNVVQSASRKTSEERRISQVPNLQTIDDQSQAQSFIEREFGQLLAEQAAANIATTATVAAVAETATAAKSKSLAQVQLTESSSSGSVTDSICTTYEQQGKQPAQDAAEAMVTSNGSSNNSLMHNNNNTIEIAEPTEHLMKAEDAGLSSMFGALFQSTNMLMSSSKKLIEAESQSAGMQPYKFNYSDFNDIDHRLKLYFYQSKFKEAGEHFKWLARGRVYNEQTQTLRDGLIVISNCKFYLMEAFAPTQDDVSKWLRQVVSVTVDRLSCIQLLPWKLGLSFTLRDWGGFMLLLQDMLRTQSLLLYLNEHPLPEECELVQQPAPEMRDYLASLLEEPLKVCTLLTSGQCCSTVDKHSFELCMLLTTDEHLYIAASGKFNWLTDGKTEPMELTFSQPMSNLVVVERFNDCLLTFNFLDETDNRCDSWQLQFETAANAECCLNAIGQSWEQLFGVPLSYTGT